jgi:hypothetical protein
VFIEPDEEHITATLYECCKCGIMIEEVKA